MDKKCQAQNHKGVVTLSYYDEDGRVVENIILPCSKLDMNKEDLKKILNNAKAN